MTLPNYDEQVDLAGGSDDGQNSAASVQPIVPGEFVWDQVMDRPIENLRKRTEVLRRELQVARYLADYDRALLLRSNGLWSLSLSTGKYTLSVTGDDLWVYPSLTPGRQSGGRDKGGKVFVNQAGSWVPYAGTLGVNDLALVAHSDHTGQRGYADGETFDSTSTPLTLGAGGITVDLVADPARNGGLATITAAFTGAPKRHITITYGTLTSTTIAQLISFINTDFTSQTTYGVANFLFASTTSGGTSAPPTLTGGVVRGAYDAEAHQITAAQITSFFSISDNQLLEGESLLVAYPAGPVELGAGAIGGRRQSLWDLPADRGGSKLQNTTPAMGYALANSGREPEKIANGIPIGKVINGHFVFVDGTRVRVGDPAIQLGESVGMLDRLALNNPAGVEGADLIGFGTTQQWHADSGDGLSAATVRDAFNEVMVDLKGTVNPSGVRRIGAETQTTTGATPNNANFTLSAASLRQQILAMLEEMVTRVDESGHFLHSPSPIEKNLGEALPFDLRTGGAVMLRCQLNPPVSTEEASDQLSEFATMLLKPWAYVAGGGNLPASQAYDLSGVTSNQLHVPGMTTGQINDLLSRAHLTIESSGSIPIRFLVAKVSGLVFSSIPVPPTYYLVTGFNSATKLVSLVRLNESAPTFASGFTLSSPSITFFHGVLVGNDPAGHRIKAFHPNDQNALAVLVGQSDNTILMEGYSPTANAPVSQYFVNRAEWDRASATPRLSANILGAADKAKLSGIENSAPIDATLNHHHGGNYTQTVFLPTVAFLSGYTNKALDTVPTAYAALTLPSSAPGGYVKTGTILRIVVTTHGTSILCKVVIKIRQPGVAGSEQLLFSSGINGNDWYATHTVMVPVAGTGTNQIEVFHDTGLSANNDDSASFLSIEEVGYVLAHT